MRIILPKTLCEIDFKYGPTFFLAGPVQGGDDWQAACCEEIRQQIPRFYAALPCRYHESHPLLSFRQGGKKNHFVRQLSWERHYLEIAATHGCIIFWLPCESTLNPRESAEPYAMDSRGELGEWRGRMIYNNKLKVVVGAEVAFPGLSQIRRNFNEALGYEFPIYTSLQETVGAAVKVACAL